jgi:cobalt-zinc-cadmium efflux system outer membrane protein
LHGQADDAGSRGLYDRSHHKSLAAGAQEAPADANAPQTLHEYLIYAALHNAGLKAAFEEWKAALEQIPQAEALPDPRFAYSYFIEHVQTRQRVGLIQMFPWFGTIAARTDAAAAAAKAAQSRYEARELQLFAEVKEAFYEYVYLAAAIESTKENLELMRHFEEVARTKYLTATGTHPDVIRAQIEVANLENDLITREQSREPVVARLNAALNRPARAPLPWPREEPGSLPTLDRPTPLAALQQHNPELRALAFDIERLGREVTLAQKRFYPDFGLGVEWMDMAMPGMDDAVRLGLELNLPIWRRSYQAGELQARARSRRAQHDRKDTENTLAARIERTAYEYEDSGRQVDLYTNVLVPRARELIGASEAAYMAGTLDFLSLIDAERMLLQFRLERERALADRRQRLAELKMLVGTELPPPASAGNADPGRQVSPQNNAANAP